MTTDTPAGTDLVFARASLQDRMDWAKAIAAAGDLVPSGFRNRDGSPNAAKILLAAETGAMLGLHPVAALNGIHVIEGKPTLSAGLMSALVRRAGHRLRVTTKGDVAKGTFEATATLIRADDPDFTYTATWNVDRAKRAGLTGKGSWGKYFESMAKARAISEVIREGAEDVLMGAAYTSEEIGGVMTGSGELIREDLIEDAELVETGRALSAADARAFQDRIITAKDEATLRKYELQLEGVDLDARLPEGSTLRKEFRYRREILAKEQAPSTDADRRAAADESAQQGQRALTLDDWRAVWRDAKHRDLLEQALTSGELLGDVLRARGEVLAEEAAHPDEPEPEPESVPVYDDALPF